jgi:4-hydroxymandelate synthase
VSIDDVAHVEIYVSDLADAIGYLVDAVGFTRIATASSSMVLQAGTATVVVTAPTAPGPVAQFLDEHGDGVADIALTCTDVDAVRDLARAAGFLTADGSAVSIPELGAMRHSLLARRHDWARLPGFWSMQKRGDGTANAPSHLDHIAFCLRPGEIEADLAGYQKIGLSTSLAEPIEVGRQALDFAVVRSDIGSAALTMVAPPGPGFSARAGGTSAGGSSTPTGPWSSGRAGGASAGGVSAGDVRRPSGFLARNGGPGVQHIALAVDDLVATVAELRSREVILLPAQDAEVSVRGPAEAAELRGTGILADSDEFGELRHIFGSSPFSRDTMYFEFIERRGARTFGARAIPEGLGFSARAGGTSAGSS